MMSSHSRREVLIGPLAACTAMGAGGIGFGQPGQKTKTIPSVLGPIPVDQLGVMLPHEHAAAAWDWRSASSPEKLGEAQSREQHDAFLGFWNLLGAELKRNGVRTILDARSEHSGRDAGMLQKISRRTGLNILCATGYYIESTRPPDFMSGGVGAAQAYMVREITEGIPGTGVRPAVIKVALGGRPGNPSDDVLLEAAARAQKETGVAITTHATTPEIRRHMLDMFERHGADLSRVAVGHADSNGSAEESAELLKRAGYVLYTVWGITNPKLIGSNALPADHSARLVRSLWDRGLGSKVMFSIDFSIYPHAGGLVLRLYDIPERTSNYIFTFVLPQLRKLGISDNEIRQMMVKNPRRHLAGV